MEQSLLAVRSVASKRNSEYLRFFPNTMKSPDLIAVESNFWESELASFKIKGCFKSSFSG